MQDYSLGRILDISVWSDIRVFRVQRDLEPVDSKYFKELQKQCGFSGLNIPGKEKYEYVVGGKANFEKLALEGEKWKWQEAFAVAEAVRIGAVELPKMSECLRGNESDAADFLDIKGRPFDVKSLPPPQFTKKRKGRRGFKGVEIIKDRIDGGGYPGATGERYPAVIIYDTSFASIVDRTDVLNDFFDFLQDKTQIWRVIEVRVAYDRIPPKYSLFRGSRPLPK
jgi:hypothetical protein